VQIGGGNALYWPMGLFFETGADTDISTGPNEIDLLILESFDQGTTWLARLYKGFEDAGVTEILPVSFTQSSLYSGLSAANTTNMRDNDFTTGTGTNSSTTEFIKADL